MQTAESTTALGDWYANLLLWRPRQIVLLVSEHALLPVIVPAKEIDTLVPRFRRATAELLAAIGIPGDAAALELGQMADCAFGATASRSVLGVMNEFAWMAEHYADALPDWTPLELALRLAETPCSPIGMRRPRDAARELLELRGTNVVMLR